MTLRNVKSCEHIIASLARRGIRLLANRARQVVIVEPAARLTDEDRSLIRRYKPEILAGLVGASAECVAAISLARRYGWHPDQLVIIAAGLHPRDEILEVTRSYIAIAQVRHQLVRTWRFQ